MPLIVAGKVNALAAFVGERRPHFAKRVHVERRPSVARPVYHQHGVARFHETLRPAWPAIWRVEPFRSLEAAAVHQHDRIRPRHHFGGFPFHIHRATLVRQAAMFDPVTWNPEVAPAYRSHGRIRPWRKARSEERRGAKAWR